MHNKLDRLENNKDFIDWLKEHKCSDKMIDVIFSLDDSTFSKIINNKKLLEITLENNYDDKIINAVFCDTNLSSRMLETQEFLSMLLKNEVIPELITSIYRAGQIQTEYGYSVEDHYRTYGIEDVYSFFVDKKDIVNLLLKYHHHYSFTQENGTNGLANMLYGGIVSAFRNSPKVKLKLSNDQINVLQLVFCNGCDSSIVSDIIEDLLEGSLKSEELSKNLNNKDLFYFLLGRSINHSLSKRRELINKCPLIQALLETNNITFRELDQCTSSQSWKESLETLVCNRAMEVIEKYPDLPIPKNFSSNSRLKYTLDGNPNSFAIFIAPIIKNLRNKVSDLSIEEVKATKKKSTSSCSIM